MLPVWWSFSLRLGIDSIAFPETSSVSVDLGARKKKSKIKKQIQLHNTTTL